jgi:NarL family two-component system response regulator LiaR
VVVVDDHEVIRAGLQVVLARQPDIHLVGMAADGAEALRVVEQTQPDVVVVDFSLPGMSGVEVCERLVGRWPGLAVIVLTNYVDDGVRLRSLRAGAKAYVHKSTDGSTLARAVRAAARGEKVETTPECATNGNGAGRGRSVLSLREIDVLRLVANGASNKDVAQELGVGVNTVKTYVQRTLEKLGCRTRTEAAAVAVKRGLL